MALEEHNARLGGVDVLAEKMAVATIDKQAEEEAILADDMAPRCSYMGRYASFDPDELDAVTVATPPFWFHLTHTMLEIRSWRSLTRRGCHQSRLVWKTFLHGLLLQT